MKYILAIALSLCLVGAVSAQTAPQTFGVAGIAYDAGIIGRVGIATRLFPLWGGTVFSYSSFDVGHPYNALTEEGALVYPIPGTRFFGGPLLGISSLWDHPGSDPVQYMNGTTGLMLAWAAKDPGSDNEWGAVGFVKRKGALDNGADYFPASWSAGMHIWLKL